MIDCLFKLLFTVIFAVFLGVAFFGVMVALFGAA